MNITQDPQLLAMIFLLPGLFGFSLIGEGINKTINYDPRGWISIIAGAGFLFVIILTYLFLSSNLLS